MTWSTTLFVGDLGVGVPSILAAMMSMGSIYSGNFRVEPEMSVVIMVNVFAMVNSRGSKHPTRTENWKKGNWKRTNRNPVYRREFPGQSQRPKLGTYILSGYLRRYQKVNNVSRVLYESYRISCQPPVRYRMKE